MIYLELIIYLKLDYLFTLVVNQTVSVYGTIERRKNNSFKLTFKKIYFTELY